MTNDPVTELSYRRLIETAKKIRGSYEDHYLRAPISYLALQIREFAKFCEESGIDDPADIQTVLTHAFTPHPAALPTKDAEFLMHLIASQGAGPSGKVKAIQSFLNTRNS